MPHGWVGIKPCSLSAPLPCSECIAGVGHRSRQNIWAHLSTSGYTCALPPAAQGPRPGHPASRDPLRDGGPAVPHAPSSSKVSPPSSLSSPVPPPSTCGSPLGPDIPPRPPAPRRRPHGSPGHARGLQPMGGQSAARVTQAGAAADSAVSAQPARRRRAGGRARRAALGKVRPRGSASRSLFLGNSSRRYAVSLPSPSVLKSSQTLPLRGCHQH